MPHCHERVRTRRGWFALFVKAEIAALPWWRRFDGYGERMRRQLCLAVAERSEVRLLGPVPEVRRWPAMDRKSHPQLDIGHNGVVLHESNMPGQAARGGECARWRRARDRSALRRMCAAKQSAGLKHRPEGTRLKSRTRLKPAVGEIWLQC